jgi:hypothetical protein
MNVRAAAFERDQQRRRDPAGRVQHGEEGNAGDHPAVANVAGREIGGEAV